MLRQRRVQKLTKESTKKKQTEKTTKEMVKNSWHFERWSGRLKPSVIETME